LKDDILNRSLNDSTSGGEKKKIEVIQAVILKPKFVILDEIDTVLMSIP
jgi:Fe-S cluster assembly ATP-binding protein